MTTSIQVRFAGLPHQYTARSWNIPNNIHPFTAMPPDATSIAIPMGGIFINGQGDRLPEQLTLDEAKTWGYNDPNDTQIIFAHAKSATSRFCLRMVFNAKEVIRHKQSNEYRAFSRLVKDAKFHATYLGDAEGFNVPIHYGMWLMDTGDWAGKVLFSITQWCGISWNELSHTRMNTEANRILIGRTFEALHDYGVHRGGLGNFENFRHAIIDVNAPGLSREDLLNGKAPCYIVGFSEAHANHQCMRKLPILPLGSYLPLKEVGCDEIGSALILLGFMKKSDTTTPVSKALEWYDKYSELYPDADNMDLAIAQRAKLYSDRPPVYPELHVSFESAEEYAKATIFRNILDSDEETELAADRVAGFRSDSQSPEPISDPLETVIDKLALAKLEHPPVASKV